MNSEGLMSAGGLSKKIISFLILMTLDVFFSSYIVFIDMSDYLADDKNPNAPFSSQAMSFFMLSGVQAILHFCLIFWFFFLIWKTFMFRFGLLRKLAGMFPILYLAPINFLAFAFERALRYVSKFFFLLLANFLHFYNSTCLSSAKTIRKRQSMTPLQSTGPSTFLLS